MLTGPLSGLIAYHALGALVGAEQCLRQLLTAGSDRRFLAPDLVSPNATAPEAAVLALVYGATAVLL
ncbi:MAG TPA: hypothetical protein VNA20_10915 [Frankiaceae bacterium]|nr:hypothetical protein [Frankiaceae bacterium]